MELLAADVKINQEEKSQNEKDSGDVSPSVHDSAEEQKSAGSSIASSQSSESDPLGSQKERKHTTPCV